jgi:cysteine synthase A
MKYDDILATVGRTPIVRLNRLAPPGINLYVKLESFNPMGSVKDRLAVAAIEQAERDGQLRPGQTVVEATSGNTGIALAMVCAAKGYPLVVTMAESFSVERRRLMRFLGARIVLTPAALKGSGMLAKAEELARRHGWFLVRQFENEANADMHTRTTAQEILADFAGERLDAWVSGYGSGGTLKGVGRELRRKRPETRIVVCEPDNSPLLGSRLEQPRDARGAPSGSHPAFRPHPMQGWTPDFVAKLAQDAVDADLVDHVVPVGGRAAMQRARELATHEGILVGITGGATLAGALEVCQSLPAGATVLCMLPDTGERYLSTPLFADVPVDMTDDEIELSRSTPGARFDAPAPAAPAGGEPPAAPALDPAAAAFVKEVITDAARPVVMFALEWCEFCWSLRRMFAHYGIEYRSIDLDSVEYQASNRGGAIRAALAAHTGVTTIPQVFVGGEFIGGCTDVLDRCADGRLQAMLDKTGVRHRRDPSVKPHSFLPGWLQSRKSA